MQQVKKIKKSLPNTKIFLQTTVKHWQDSLIVYKVKPTTNPVVYFSIKNKIKTEGKKLIGLTKQNIKFFCTPLPKKGVIK